MTTTARSATAGAPALGEVLAVLEGAYPLSWAEDWDRPGLVVGGRSEAR